MLKLRICLPQQVLNCALDDIEIFVARLQKAAEAFSQLNQRNKSKKNKKKGPAGLSPFLLMWWHKCCDNIFILLTSPCLCLFVSCGAGHPLMYEWYSRLGLGYVERYTSHYSGVITDVILLLLIHSNRLVILFNTLLLRSHLVIFQCTYITFCCFTGLSDKI